MNQHTKTDSNVEHHDLYLTGALKRDFISVNGVGGVYDIKPDQGDAFIFTATGSIDITMSNIGNDNVGQSGTIVIINGAGAGYNALPSNMLTPSGADIQWVTTQGAISIISYIIVDVDAVLVNYIGNFA